MAKITNNRKLFNEAKRYLVGGVDSPVRSFNYVGIDPILIEKGKGSKIYDYDGGRYIDYVLSWGSAILGHAYPDVVKDIMKSAGYGSSFGATNKIEIELAKAISKAIPFVEKIRFVNSGTEAVMGAIRLARAFTGRDKILKFENSYHGHADYMLARAGSGLATLNIPSSKGVPKDFVKHTLIARFDDKKNITALFKRYGGSIAAVIVEPVGGNYGVIPPDMDQLKFLRRISKKYGSSLIFDEVITGFRFNYGSFAQEAGVVPDIICLGKIIGCGLPIGAYGGSARIMDNLAPLGRVYQASTFSGNPIVMRSGLSTLNAIRCGREGYARIEGLAKDLIVGIWEAAGRYKTALNISSYKNIFSLKFNKKKDFRVFYKTMLDNGVYFAPSEFETNFISFAHTKKDIDYTIKAADAALRRIAR